MIKYNIPKSFEIGSQKISVKIAKNIEVEGALGLYSSLTNEILIQTHIGGKLMAASQIEQTYYHELVHCLFDHARQEDLCSNEQLVDLVAELLAQVIKSSK